MKRLGTMAAAIAMILGTSLATQAMNNGVLANQMTTIEVVAQDEFSEVDTDDLPDAVKKAAADNYEGYEIDKAYVNEDKIYKLEIKNDVNKKTVYFNESGEEQDL